MIKNKKLILFIVSFLLLGTGFVLGIGFKRKAIQSQINSFEECVAVGYPISQSYPRQCRTPDGRTFVEQINRGEFPQKPSQDSPPTSVDEDSCEQAKYQEACEARPDCLWIGCPNNVCVQNR